MPTLRAMLGIGLVALTLVVTPGPNMLYLLSRTITQGRQAGMLSLAGIAAGFLVYLAATAAGVTALFQAVPAVYTMVKIAGAVYLLWLASQALRPSGQSIFAPQPMPIEMGGVLGLLALRILTEPATPP